MPNPIAYFELGGRDAEALSDFYRDLLGWKIEKTPVSAAPDDYFYVEPSEGGVGGGILKTMGDMPPNYVMIYISVDDLQACLDKAASIGAKTFVPPTEIPGGMGHFAVFQDPAGNVMGLHASD